MSRISTCTLAIAVWLGTMALFANSKNTVKPVDLEASFAADGAFRDGLYLGKLAAEHGDPIRPAIGRWSAYQDRSMFTAGYYRGYHESLANARVNKQRMPSTE